eukprot:m.150146 g.150146  ORF g.150146 m.150146 type:complete len:146 (+) comp38543_c0_seq14:254-691(+)
MENRFQLEPDLVQGMPTHFHNQTALAKPLLSPSPRVRLTQLFKAQSIPAVPEWFAVTWRCDKLREGSDSGNSHDGKLCTTLGYESHSIISVSRSADVDALSWTENGLYQVKMTHCMQKSDSLICGVSMYTNLFWLAILEWGKVAT